MIQVSEYVLALLRCSRDQQHNTYPIARGRMYRLLREKRPLKRRSSLAYARARSRGDMVVVQRLMVERNDLDGPLATDHTGHVACPSRVVRNKEAYPSNQKVEPADPRLF